MRELFIQPPEIVELNDDDRVVFLAGPIQGAPKWQYEAERIIHSLDAGIVVASPRKDYSKGEFVYERQVDWETHFLNRAARVGAIIFWLALQVKETPGRPFAQTSRFELGEWKVKHETTGANVVVGIEEGFPNERYIRHRLGQDCPKIPILSSLQETCKTAVDII
ncbi:MAG TPA: hypothetical protein VMR51_01815 [Patescibacteria group bacterium]|nr:hypothetical protein [Patescibacteria group bacterium]